MEESSKIPTKAVVGLVAAVLLVIVATAAVVVLNSENDRSATNSSSTAPAENRLSATAFKDGTYEATGEYNTPGGEEAIDVKITLEDNAVAEVSVVSRAISREATDYQHQFISAYEEKVLGKKVDEVSLSRVAGSSLTPIGFNRAIEKIRSEAAI